MKIQLRALIGQWLHFSLAWIQYNTLMKVKCSRKLHSPRTRSRRLTVKKSESNPLMIVLLFNVVRFLHVTNEKQYLCRVLDFVFYHWCECFSLWNLLNKIPSNKTANGQHGGVVGTWVRLIVSLKFLYTLSLCLYGFSPVSSHGPKTCQEEDWLR